MTDEPRTALGRRHAVFAELRGLGLSPLDGRKTFRVVTKRRKPHQMPPWRLRFVLPRAIAFAVSPGPIDGVIGAKVIEIGASLIVEVTGGPREWVINQGLRAAQALGFDIWPLCARLTRSADDAAPITGPYEREQDRVVELSPRSVSEGGAMRTLGPT